MNRSMIGNLTVSSKQDYIVYGSVRGLISEHRVQSAAVRRADKDRKDCRGLGGGAYSDACVYRWQAGEWTMIEEAE